LKRDFNKNVKILLFVTVIGNWIWNIYKGLWPCFRLLFLIETAFLIL
jgi:hypothetical protein